MAACDYFEVSLVQIEMVKKLLDPIIGLRQELQHTVSTISGATVIDYRPTMFFFLMAKPYHWLMIS